MIGRRWDVHIKEPMDFSGRWEEKLKSYISKNGKVHGHTGIDFLIFPKGLFGEIPPFALGRTIRDNWLVYRARLQKVPVVDLTQGVTVIHQNRVYSHHVGKTGVWNGEEAKRNLVLAGGYGYAFTIVNATHKLTRKGLKKNLSPYIHNETSNLIYP